MAKLFAQDVADRLSEFDSVAVAVSGGRDSVALLHYLVFSGVYSGKIVALNVNHRIRGGESDDDTEFVRSLAESYRVPVVVHSADVPAYCREHGYGLEQGARLVRRQLFADIVASGEVQRVLTAHHLSDQTESVLMHVFRGSGIDGLCGMREDDGVIFRPMLATRVDVIDDYVAEHGLSYRVDSSNRDNAYSRNYLRNVVVPSLKKLYPSLEQNVARLSGAARDAADFVASQCVPPRREGDEVFLDEAAFDAPPACVAASVLKALEAAGARIDAARVHVLSIIALKDKNNGARVSLPHFFVAEKRRGAIVVFKDKGGKDLAEIPYARGEFSVGNTLFRVSPDARGLMLDEDKIPPGSVFRTRREGDVFKKFKGGTKSLGDYLTDKKIPLSKRDGLALLAHGSDVLAIVGIEISDSVAVRANSRVVKIQEVKK